MLQDELLTEAIIGAAIAVHEELGPGLLESAYEECLCFELGQLGIPYARQVPLPVVYKGIRLECGYRMDVVVDSKVLIELKSIDSVEGIHKAQVLTYLRLSGLRTALLLNFNVAVLKNGMTRLVL
jgi:GxxExxY protein